MKRSKVTYNLVKGSFNSEGYTLLDKIYINSHIKLNYVCPEGHIHSVRWYAWKNGTRCFYCAKIKQGKRCRHNISYIKKIISSQGYTLKSNEYLGAFKPIKISCNNNHIYTTNWHNFSTGRRCPVCKIDNRLGEGNPNWKGGISYEPYCQVWADKDFKNTIKVRDNSICQNPYCYNDSNTLCIHHIDYNKKNCAPNNLITVCRNCNTRANYSREWHKLWYKTIMYKRGIL